MSDEPDIFEMDPLEEGQLISPTELDPNEKKDAMTDDQSRNGSGPEVGQARRGRATSRPIPIPNGVYWSWPWFTIPPGRFMDLPKSPPANKPPPQAKKVEEEEVSSSNRVTGTLSRLIREQGKVCKCGCVHFHCEQPPAAEL